MKILNLLKPLLFAFLIMVAVLELGAQVNIQGPATICSGDLANFKIANSSGKGIKSYKWDFGDGKGSAMPAPSYLYHKTGNYVLTCELIFTDNTSNKSTQKIEVLELPTANFTTKGNLTSFCQYKANVCFENKSKEAASNRPLHKMIVTWGDGNLDVEKNNPLANTVCHNYEEVGDFKIRFEIVDTKGCKNVDYKRINIIEGVKAEIKTSIQPDCNEVKFCVDAKIEPKNAKYEWYINGINSYGNISNFCETYNKKTKIDAVLIVKNNNTQCKDTIRLNDSVEIAPKSIKLKTRTKKMCYNDSVYWAEAVLGGNITDIQWYLNNQLLPERNKIILINTKSKYLKPGKYDIKCVAKFGKCSIEIIDTFRIVGPIAGLKAWNTVQCNTNYKVFFVDSSRNTNKRCSWKWSTEDGVSDNCSIWRAKNQNRFKNCYYTLDWWGKHKYPDEFVGDLKFTVYDSITGCSDDTSVFVNLDACSKCLSIGHIDICQGDSFLVVPKNYFNPRFFSLDTGKTWMPFPSRIGKPYLGTYGVTFIVPHNKPNFAEDFGNDSFRIITVPVTFDTIFKPGFLTINETPALDFVTIKSEGCRECKITIYFNKHKFKADENLFITWKNKEWRNFFGRDTMIDSMVLYSKIKGGADLFINYFNASGCRSVYKLYAGCGLDMEINQAKTDCFGNLHCIELKARDNAADSFYNMYKAGINYKLSWGNKWFNNQNKICKIIDSVGVNKMQYICTDKKGCTDTLRDSVLVQKVRAGVTPDSKIAYCSELKQLFDSSYAIGGDGKIVSYGWNFNRRNRNSSLKDPVQLFEKGGKNHIIHWVTSSYGCTDTMEYDVEILGSNPYFTIPDTMGCVEFDAVFKNRSKNCKTYIWEFGDPNQSIISVSDTNDVHYTYTAPGIFNINLIGIDTIYSSITGEAYHCHVSFPDNKDTIRRVHVLPYYKSTLTGPDSICENEQFVITSGTDADANYDNWIFPAGNKMRIQAGSSLKQNLKRGSYTYQLRPDYGWNPSEPYCADTPKLAVTVIGIDADFDFKSIKNDGNYSFTNLSSTEAVGFIWNFGHPTSGSKNSSMEKDPEHDYFPDTGEFKACLIAKNILGCLDTVCKIIPQYYMEYLFLANVFTPENQDGKNDLYDVIISGEKEYDLKILNRFGELVYHSKSDGDRFSDNINWNGKVHNTGATCPEGTYFYQFTWSYNRNPDKVKSLNGSVNLIR